MLEHAATVSLKPNIPRPFALTSKPSASFPHGAVDSHAHIFDNPEHGGLVPNPHFVPNECTLFDYRQMLNALGCDKAVLVQPSVYGTNNSVLLGALEGAEFDVRGVVIVEPEITDRALQDLHELGVRGVRINTASATPGLKLHQAPALAERIRQFGWHLQFFVDLQSAPETAAVIASLPLKVVIDHVGRVPARLGTTSPAFRALLELMEREHCWVKLMGPYFISDQYPSYADTDPLVDGLLRTAPDRCVWGTDWPHPSARERMPDDGDLADLLYRWVPDNTLRHKVLIDNPGRLYGFETAA